MVRFFFFASLSTIIIVFSTIEEISTGTSVILVFPFSILAISSTLLISPRSCSLATSMLERYSFSWSALLIFLFASSVNPTMAFIGVLISWDMLKRNWDLALLAISACSLAADIAMVCSTSSSMQRDREIQNNSPVLLSINITFFSIQWRVLSYLSCLNLMLTSFFPASNALIKA